MDPARLKRQEEIKQALLFIQSPLPFPDPDGYQEFLTKLVCNLLEEGNTFFLEGQSEQAVREFSEGLNVSRYAEVGQVHIPTALLESLYVNRAAAYHDMGEFDRGVLDCDSVLEMCEGSHRALYRKAQCLNHLGKFREAYECITNCLLVAPLDQQVKDLAQQLTARLGLKGRVPYISAKVPAHHLGNGWNSLPSVASVVSPSMQQSSCTSSSLSYGPPAGSGLLDEVGTLEDLDVMGDDLDRLLDGFPAEPEPTKVMFTYPCAFTLAAPPGLPAPTPKLPPAFFSSAVSQLSALDSFSSDRPGASAAALDILDDLSVPGAGDAPHTLPASSALDAPDQLDHLDTLDSLDDFLNVKLGPAVEAAEHQAELNTSAKSRGEILDELDLLDTVPSSNGLSGAVPKKSFRAVDHLESLDALDLFTSEDGAGRPSSAVSMTGRRLNSISNVTTAGVPNSHTTAARVIRSPQNHDKGPKEKDNQGPTAISNPLFATHEFLQACSTCFPREGRGVYSYIHKPNLAHRCKRDILLCRLKSTSPSDWTRVRPMPAGKSFTGPFVLCRELLSSGELGVCKYGENCTFAYNQLEIDVWTEERKGALDRHLLFETTAAKLDPVFSMVRLLQENKGTFMFLCQDCYDNKPRIISERCRQNQTICSNMDVHHHFDANKCLVFVVRSHNVTYRKVRPLSVTCQLDLCRQAVRYGCQREDACLHAHSVIELKTWRMQRDTGISFDEIVKLSERFNEKQEPKSSKLKGNGFYPGGFENKPKGGGGGGAGPGGGGGGGGAGKSLDMRMKFVCAFCWRDGLISEPDKSLKHCSAKTRHAWTKEKRVLLVKSLERSKWIQVRPLPHQKHFPQQYEMCTQILKRNKCTFTGPCTFAHSPEEKEMWMYMKKNELLNMQQMYDMWLSLTTQKNQVDEVQASTGEKSIMMPTDYAEPLSGFHCRLCGRHSNSERQWQQHISSEKHKDKVFSCEGEDEALMWRYRFPGTQFQLCTNMLDADCPDGASCDFAHSPEELQEWTERRNFLRQKLAKARDDMLIMPDEFDFGKYNFLLQD